MSRSKHTEAAIIAALKQVGAGRKAEDVAREQGVSKHTVYAWKAKYGGMDVSEAEEVKHLRDENARLKKLVADLSLDKDMLQSVIRKTPWAPTPATWTCCWGPRPSTKGRSEALAAGLPGQRAPRLRADEHAEDDLPVPEPPQ
jgi:putative transposase